MASPPDKGDDREERRPDDAPSADTLCDAVRANNVSLVQHCLQSVPVNAKDSTTFTAVRLACLYGTDECLRALIKARANIHHRDAGGAGVLHKAARAGHTECVALLLQHSAKANLQTHGFRDTPLMQAASQGHPAVVDLLLANGAEPHMTDVHGRTARELAKHAGRHEVTKRLPKPSRDDKGAVRAGSTAGSTATCSTCGTPSEAKRAT